MRLKGLESECRTVIGRREPAQPLVPKMLVDLGGDWTVNQRHRNANGNGAAAPTIRSSAPRRCRCRISPPPEVDASPPALSPTTPSSDPESLKVINAPLDPSTIRLRAPGRECIAPFLRQSHLQRRSPRIRYRDYYPSREISRSRPSGQPAMAPLLHSPGVSATTELLDRHTECATRVSSTQDWAKARTRK
jgi:hypothetical protein